MSSYNEFLEDLIDKKLTRVEIGFVAQILSFNPSNLRATIRPLLEYKDAFNDIQIPDIENVPCELLYSGGYYIRPFYQSGDLVTVSAYASDVKKAVDSSLRVNALNERFSLSNCTVRNGIAPKTISETGFSRSGLVIGKGAILINITDTNIIIESDVSLTGNLDIDGDLTVTGDIIADGDVKAGTPPISLRHHTHNYSDNGTPSVTGEPNP